MRRRWIIAPATVAAPMPPPPSRSRVWLWRGIYALFVVFAMAMAVVMQLSSRRDRASQSGQRNWVYRAGWPWSYAHPTHVALSDWPALRSIAWQWLTLDVVLLTLIFLVVIYLLYRVWRELLHFGRSVSSRQLLSALLIGIGGTGLWFAVSEAGPLPGGGASWVGVALLPGLVTQALENWFAGNAGLAIPPTSLASNLRWLLIIGGAIGMPATLPTILALWVARLRGA